MPEPYPSPDRTNLWWFVAAGGIAAILLATVIVFFNNLDGVISDKEKAPAFFWLLGHVAVVGALGFMAAMQTGWNIGIRLAALALSVAVATGALDNPFLLRYVL